MPYNLGHHARFGFFGGNLLGLANSALRLATSSPGLSPRRFSKWRFVDDDMEYNQILQTRILAVSRVLQTKLALF